MNKVTKATIAAAAAVALFGGGAGSLAYWQAEASTDELQLQMGHVEVRAYADGTYTLNGETMTYDTLRANRLVPGDVVIYQHNFQIDVGGTDAVLRVGDLDFGTTDQTVLDAIETDLEVAPTGSTEYMTYSSTNEPRAFNVTGFGSWEVKVTLTVPADLEDMSSAVNGVFLEPVPVTVTQVTEPLPAPEG